MKPLIKFDEFIEIGNRLEIKVGKIIHVQEIPKSSKLIKLTVSFGEDDIRTVVTNIKNQLIDIKGSFTCIEGVSFLFITNLHPVQMMGIESTAMIMPGELEKSLLCEVIAQSGTKIL